MPDNLARMMPAAQHARINAIQMAYYEAGPRCGVPVILCHGWPELAFSWRWQMKALAAAGYWVVAPDQRGFGLTDRPESVEAYDIRQLTGDLTGLLDHLGVDRAVFCGHDWGGVVVWQLALLHPDRVSGLISLNTPFVRRPPADPIAILRRRFGADMYIVHIQEPGDADAILARDVRKTFSYLMRRPDPAQPRSGGFTASADAAHLALIRNLEAYDPAADRRAAFLTDREMGVFVETFERTGFTGGLNWYRNFTRNWDLTRDVEQRIRTPALMVTAEDDALLPPSSTEGMETHMDDLSRALVRASGHWTQQERPAAVNRAILGWLGR